MKNKNLGEAKGFQSIRIDYIDKSIEEDGNLRLLANLLHGQKLELEVEDIQRLSSVRSG